MTMGTHKKPCGDNWGHGCRLVTLGWLNAGSSNESSGRNPCGRSPLKFVLKPLVWAASSFRSKGRATKKTKKIPPLQ